MYDEKKNKVFLRSDSVQKNYQSGKNTHKRFLSEIRALRRLESLDSVPNIIKFDLDKHVIVMQRISGIPLTNAKTVPPEYIKQLQILVYRIIDAGIARHSLPLRDILLQPNGMPALVDFERCTLRLSEFGLSWNIAKAVTKLHLLRVVKIFHPEMLSEKEKKILRIGDRLERVHKAIRKIRDKFV